MQLSNITLPARARQLAIAACAVATLGAAAAANAATTPAAPKISGTPATTGVTGKAYSFTPTATGPSGYTLRFTILDMPSWATFNSTTGKLSGTPTIGGTYHDIVEGVTDGVAKATLPAFSITVSKSTSASTSAVPTISGTPATTATVGTAYSFTPKASVSNGDALSFSITNKPSWASFSIATGAISGTPAAANVGTDSSIVISVSDGTASASLSPFAITVSQAASTTGSAKLTWTAPTTNTNGSALTDLAGYHLYYGKSSSSLTNEVQIANPATTTYTVSSLAAGTWYFEVNAYTSGGQDSAMSNVGSKTIP